jgi:5,10-methylenetetrahydromethanopterin reductase
MMTMAGSVADGILLDAVPIECVEYAISKIRAGLKTTGRKENFRYANCIMCMISDDGDAARNIVKRFPFPQFLIKAPHQMLDMAKIGREDVAMIQSAVPNWEKASALITDEMVEKLSITGTPQECLRRIKAYVEKGMNEFCLVFPLGADVKKMVKFLDEDIIPRIKKNVRKME